MKHLFYKIYKYISQLLFNIITISIKGLTLYHEFSYDLKEGWSLGHSAKRLRYYSTTRTTADDTKNKKDSYEGGVRSLV